ncbi:MAG TPA: RNA-binding protein [Stellaceae bacterium]|nr:RNA-binding protein [Stellaceae bacterium]
MWARNNKGNVFVGNLPPDFPDERLAEAFDPFGIVLTAAVARDPSTGARLRYGFVDIATEKAATQAIAALDGSEIDGCKLNVKPRERAATAKQPADGRPRRPTSGAVARNGVPHAAAPNGISHPAASMRRMPAPAAQMPPLSPQSRSEPVQRAQSQSAQSQLARDGLPEIEPPPRRDFEVVRRPIRRGTPSFQIERRPLPRRV